MRQFLDGQAMDELDEFDREEAIYWFAADYHGGQASNLYSALSTSSHHPGPLTRGPEEGSDAEFCYVELEQEYAREAHPCNRLEEPTMTKNDYAVAAAFRNASVLISEASAAQGRREAWAACVEAVAVALGRRDDREFLIACCETVADRNSLAALVEAA